MLHPPPGFSEFPVIHETLDIANLILAVADPAVADGIRDELRHCGVAQYYPSPRRDTVCNTVELFRSQFMEILHHGLLQ
jgi:hypothetical protein